MKIIILFMLYVSSSVHGYSINLRRLSTLYIPQYLEATGQPYYQYNFGSIEQIAYDANNKVVYTAGHEVFHVIDVSDPSNMKILDHKVYPKADLTDVEFCGEHVFVAINNETSHASRLKGEVHVLKKYHAQSVDSLNPVHKIYVGALPDMIKPTRDCSTVLVAVEGEAFGVGTEFIDPKGGVGVIKFPKGVENAFSYNELNFTAFNNRVYELQKDGVRFVYRKDGNTFDRDVEPEFIVYNSDETLAYISLQENNAIAVVDLRTTSITKIYGLGYKSWSSSKLDASDKDGGIHLNNYDIRSFYLPDAINYNQWNEKNIIITANEGDGKDYESLNGFVEYISGGKIISDRLSDKIPQTVKTALANNSMLGRLKISNVDGLDSNNKFKQLYSYGGRGFTIRQASDMSILYDSGDIMEKKIAYYQPEIFNSVCKADRTVREKVDSRSDNRGPESESLATAELNGRLVIFVGNERPGTITVFSVGNNFTETRFEYLYHNIPNFDKDFRYLYDERNVSEIDPEDIRFIPDDQSPTGGPVLFVAGTVSGTLSIIEVNVESGMHNTSNTGGVSTSSGVLYLTASTIVASIILWKIA